MSRFDPTTKPRYAAQIAAQMAPKGKGRGKYRNERVEAHGRTWDSKLELAVYERLCREWGQDSVLLQVSVPVGVQACCGRLRVDFFTIEERFPDGSFRGRLRDAKGVVTEGWQAKANHLMDRFGLEIKLER